MSDVEIGLFYETKVAEAQGTQQPDLQNYQLARDKSRRQIRALVRYDYAYLIAYTLIDADDILIE